jgi:hypothetical protein
MPFDFRKYARYCIVITPLPSLCLWHFSSIFAWANSILLSASIADDLPTKIRKLRVAIEALEVTGKPQNIAGTKTINSALGFSETILSNTAQNRFDEETASSKLIPGRIGLATHRIHDPG